MPSSLPMMSTSHSGQQSHACLLGTGPDPGACVPHVPSFCRCSTVLHATPSHLALIHGNQVPASLDSVQLQPHGSSCLQLPSPYGTGASDGLLGLGCMGSRAAPAWAALRAVLLQYAGWRSLGSALRASAAGAALREDARLQLPPWMLTLFQVRWVGGRCLRCLGLMRRECRRVVWLTLGRGLLFLPGLMTQLQSFCGFQCRALEESWQCCCPVAKLACSNACMVHCL